jgi:phage tail P2-like protein
MAEPTPVTTLLPPNAIDAERALEAATARLGDVAVPIGDLWSPSACPEALLAWLAWALSVDEWNPQWSATIKREVIAQSISVHLRKGSVASVRRALAAIGFTDYVLTEWWQDAPEEGFTASHTGEPHTYSLGLNPLTAGIDLEPGVFESVLRTLAHTAPVRSHLALYVKVPSAAELGLAAALGTYTHVHRDAALVPGSVGFSAGLGMAAATAGYTHVHRDAEWT